MVTLECFLRLQPQGRSCIGWGKPCLNASIRKNFTTHNSCTGHCTMKVLSSFPLVAKALQLALQAWRKIPEIVSRCPVCILSHAENFASSDLPLVQAV